MRTFSIESNGRIEKTALYLNGEQLSGVNEVFIHIDEDGTFDAVIEYVGSDGQARTKQLFTDYLDKMKVTPPVFTEEEARYLQLLTIESNGDVSETLLYYNDVPLEGVVDILLHIRKGASNTSSLFTSLIKGKKTLPDDEAFRAEMMFRNENDTLELETLFL